MILLRTSSALATRCCRAALAALLILAMGAMAAVTFNVLCNSGLPVCLVHTVNSGYYCMILLVVWMYVNSR